MPLIKKKDSHVEVPDKDIYKIVTTRSDENLYKASLLHLNPRDLKLQTAQVKDNTLTVVYSQSKHASWMRSTGRVLRVLDEISPEKIKTFEVGNVNGGLGMFKVKIDRDDFIYILETGLGRQIIDNDETFGIITAHNQMNSQNYRVEDDFGNVKIRGAMQKKFSDEVKNNYNNKCAVTGISTRSLLIGSHIIPWSKDKDRRLDPSNGICLSSLVDKCFEEGLIVIDTDYRLRVSKNLDNDKELRLYLNKFNGKKINLPKNKDNYPNIDCLKYRINNFN